MRGRERLGLSENLIHAFKACSERCDRLLRIHYLHTLQLLQLYIKMRLTFPEPVPFFQDFSGLENATVKF